MNGHPLPAQIGTFDISELEGGSYHAQFDPIQAERHVVDWSSDVTYMNLPRYLTNFPDRLEGAKSLCLKVSLPVGVYRLTVGFLDNATPSDKHSGDWTLDDYYRFQMFFEVALDDRRIGNFVNRPPITAPPLRDRVLTRTFAFVAQNEGEHSLTVSAFRPDEFMDRLTAAAQVAFVGYRIDRIESAVSDSFRDELPGRVALDGWGWHFPLAYERSHVNCIEATPEDYRRQVVDELYKWGGNLVEFYSICDAIDAGTTHTDAMPWPLDLNDPASVSYRANPFSAWTADDIQDAIGYAHQRGMLFEWFSHFAMDPELAAKSEDDTDAASNAYDQAMAHIWWQRAFLQRMLDQWGDATRRSWPDLLDGSGFEGGFTGIYEDAGEIHQRLTEDAWSRNPGLIMSASGQRAPRLPWGPAFMMYFACSGMGGRFKNGTDDLDPLQREPDDYWYRPEDGGRIFHTYQADMRMMRRFPQKGGSHPDWILKQCNDFFRQRRVQPGRAFASSIRWINEELGRPHIRHYVYGVSQDPLRSAVAGFYTSTGEGGRFDWKSRQKLTVGPHSAEGHYDLQPRRRLPHTTNFLRNNLLEVLLFPREEGGKLRVDMQGLGHFDDDSLSIDLIDQLIETVRIIDGESQGARVAHGKVRKFHEYAGHKACVEEYVRIDHRRKPFEEFRRFTLLNDSPILSMRVRRVDARPRGIVETRLGCPRNASLVVNDQVVSGPCRWSSLPSALVFRSTSGLLGGLALIVREVDGFDHLRYEPEECAVVIASRAQSEACVDLTWALLHGRYREADVPALIDDLSAQEQSLTVGEDGVDVRADVRVPLVAALRVLDADDRPYLVRERGWWLFRGAQPSREFPGSDYVKLYLTPDDVVRVMPDGFIEGLVKPGWGSQYLLALRDIAPAQEEGARLTVAVLSQTPEVFAPRVQFARPVGAVTLDGCDWHYFDGDVVFLPQDQATHDLCVRFGPPTTPHLTRTFGNVRATSWDGRTFEAQIDPPFDCQRLWEPIQLYATIRTPGTGETRCLPMRPPGLCVDLIEV